MPSFAVPESAALQSGGSISCSPGIIERWANRPQTRRHPRNRPEDRLDSWKEIAAYLDRDVTTVQRWERREGMPVHRHLHDKRGSVYALGSRAGCMVAKPQAAFGAEGTNRMRKRTEQQPSARVERPGAGRAHGNDTAGARLARFGRGWSTRSCSPSLTSCPEAARGMRRNPKSGLWRCCP